MEIVKKEQTIRPICFGIVVIALVATIVVQRLEAQGTSTSIALLATQFKLNRLAPGVTTGQATVIIDNANIITVEIIATVAGLITSIEGPGGQVINETTV